MVKEYGLKEVMVPELHIYKKYMLKNTDPNLHSKIQAIKTAAYPRCNVFMSQEFFCPDKENADKTALVLI